MPDLGRKPPPEQAGSRPLVWAGREQYAAPVAEPTDSSETVLPSQHAPAPAPAPLPPRRPTRLGPYEVVSEVGRGGMGTVYKVRHVELETVRAVKVVGQASSARALARFRREAHNLARVVHPGVARVHETGEADGCRWFAMEYVEGEPLHRLLARERLPLGRALELALSIAEGVAALHEVGVIHRDLKPSNVVISAATGRPVVLDLGLAVAPELDVRLTSTGATLGTVQYMAPEQFHGAEGATLQTDVYALGALLFELVTGRPAVPREASTPELAARIITEDRPRPSQHDPELPAALDDLCGRAMARVPAERPADAGVLAAELRALLEDLGPTARVVRQRRRLVGLGVGATLAAAGLGVGLATLSGASDEPPARPAAVTTASPPAQRVSPQQVAAGQAELDRLALLAPAERRAELEAWVRAWPEHPDRTRAEALLGETLLGEPWRVLRHPGAADAAFLADGRAVTVGGDGHVRVWDLERAEPVTTLHAGWYARTVAVAPDGRRFAFAGNAHQVVWVDAEGASHVLHRVGRGAAFALAFAPDGQALAVGGSQPEVVVYRFPSGEPRLRLGGHKDPVRALAFSPDGRTLVTGSGKSLEDPPPHDNAVRLFDATSGALRKRVKLWSMAHDLAFDPRGEVLAVACDGTKVRLLEGGVPVAELIGTGTEAQALAPTSAHGGLTTGVAFAAHGELLASTSHTRHELRAWRMPGREQLLRVERPHDLRRVRFDREGSRVVAVSGRGDRVEVWDLGALRE